MLHNKAGNQRSTDDVVFVHMIMIVYIPNVCMSVERYKPYVEAQSLLPITVTSERGECVVPETERSLLSRDRNIL